MSDVELHETTAEEYEDIAKRLDGIIKQLDACVLLEPKDETGETETVNTMREIIQHLNKAHELVIVLLLKAS